MARIRGSARRRWLDPRLAIGLVLVAASVLGVFAIVRTSDDTTLVYEADSPLAVGDTITPSRLRAVPVRLGELSSHYLLVSEAPSGTLVVTRPVLAGELVPARAVSTKADDSRTRVVVTVQGPLSAAVTSGSRVDVWASRAREGGNYDSPAILVSGARAVDVIESQGIVTDGRGVSLELDIPKTSAAAVLESLARGDAVTVLPSSGS